MRVRTIREMPAEQRPREKLLTRGPNALTDSELIAILLRTGVPGENALQLAQTLLNRYGGVTGLAQAGTQELAKTRGIGLAKSIQLRAAFGLGGRLTGEKLQDQALDSPALIYELLAPDLLVLDRESLRLVALNTKYRLVSVREISCGTLNESLAHPREIYKPAITLSAYAIVLVHNHPSGDPTPSEADLKLTRKLAEAGRILQIPLLDHVIVGQPAGGRCGYFSFKEAGLLA
jgi:DNA repair protein RadC